jgi:hypothetical protein
MRDPLLEQHGGDARTAVRSLTNTYFELGEPNFYIQFVELSFNTYIKELLKYNVHNSAHTATKQEISVTIFSLLH